MRLGPALVLALSVSAPAAALPSRQEVPQFRTGVSAVLVDVLVLDEDGRPVTGLAREDFEVYEDGVRQEIATFDVTDWTSYVAQETGAGPTGDAELNTYPRRFIFIVNRRGAEFQHLNRAKRALSTFIVDFMAEGDEAMVIDIGYSTKILQELQSGKQEALESVRNLSQMRIDYPMGADRSAIEIYRDLEAIGESLASIAGRKVIVLLSNELLTFSTPGSRNVDAGLPLKEAIDALNQANASVYTIDIRGPEASFGSATYGGLSPLANETRGRFFRNTPSFDTPLERIGRENERYYLLGYVAINKEADGEYRRIEVRVDRPDVEVIARRGYYARSPEMRTSDAEKTAAPAASPPELPLAVELTTYLLPTGGESVRVPVSVALPEDLLTGQGGNDRKLSVTVRDEDGSAVHAFEEPVSLERYYVLRNLELEPGAYVLEVAVSSEERELYRASTGVRIPSGMGERFGLSSIVPVVSPESSASVGNDLPILPTAAVKRGESLHVLFQIFPGGDDPAENARVSYRILDENGAEEESGGPDRDIALRKAPDGTPVVLSLPTRELSYGRYRVEVRVEDPESGERAASEIEFRVR